MANAVIDLDALRQNYKHLKQLAPESRTLAVIKADAYGHGLAPVALALENSADGLAVARLEEALRLRDAGVRNTILLLDGVLTGRELQSAVSHRFKIVLHDYSQIALVEAFARKHDLPMVCWLKVNTGMNRLGFSLDDLPQVLARLGQVKNVNCECLMTHLANADSGKQKDQDLPLERFEQAKALCPDIKQYSIANSAALLCYPKTHRHWNRPGISLFGCTTVKQSSVDLQPVMHLTAPIIAIHDVKKGQSVGYGSTWTSKTDTCIAVIGIGYGDGYPRHAKNGTPVSIKGKDYPLAGRVSMDMITVDLGANEAGLKVGDTTVLWGKTDSGVLSADTIADFSNTISYELFCKVTNRVTKEYIGG